MGRNERYARLEGEKLNSYDKPTPIGNGGRRRNFLKRKEGVRAMLNLSIMPLDEKNLEEICADIIRQQRDGVSNCAMFLMEFSPIGTPAQARAKELCKIYDKARAILDKAGAKHGVLVQSTLGHIVKPSIPHSFQNAVSLIDGAEQSSTCCPFDGNFRAYIREQMRELATHNPSIIMIDDDVGLLYRPWKGCACPLHMARLSELAGRNIAREELYARTQGNTEEDKYVTDLYVKTVEESLVGAVKAMREGIDMVNPAIMGAVSGIYSATGFCEFSDKIAEAFAGKGNPKIIRLNSGIYTASTGRNYSSRMFRLASLREYLKGKYDILLAETDTCPQNRYSTSASLLHMHFTSSILEGAKGAKHWITRLSANEPNAGKAYRAILSKNSAFYEKLCQYVEKWTAIGCRVPIPHTQNYGFVPDLLGNNLSPWTSAVLERMGIPFYFGNDGKGAVLLDNVSVDKFTDEEIFGFLHETVFLSGGAVEKLIKRGFLPYLGVSIRPWKGKNISFELVNGHKIAAQMEYQELVVENVSVEALSYAIHTPDSSTIEKQFPAVTAFVNPLGGKTVAFCGNPDAPFRYYTAFSFLCETRKKQLIDIFGKAEGLTLYYPEDAEIYIRAGRLENGEILCAFFNLGLDVLENIPLCCKERVRKVEKLTASGERETCDFEDSNGVVIIKDTVQVLEPKILFLS